MKTQASGDTSRPSRSNVAERESLVVAVLKLLSPRVRERFCYVALAVGFAVFALGLCFAPGPTITCVGAAVAGRLSRWIGR
jgi:hypothetical protein